MVESGLHAEAFSHDGHQDIDRDSNPYLRFDRVLAGSIEGLDAPVLLDPVEQQGDILPINIIVPMKSRFTILFTICALTGYR